MLIRFKVEVEGVKEPLYVDESTWQEAAETACYDAVRTQNWRPSLSLDEEPLTVNVTVHALDGTVLRECAVQPLIRWEFARR